MKFNFFNKLAGGALVILLCAAVNLHAQQRFGGGNAGGGGFGGFGGFGGNNANRGGSSATTSSYNGNGTVGNAIINVDPNTHNLIVIADKATA